MNEFPPTVYPECPQTIQTLNTLNALLVKYAHVSNVENHMIPETLFIFESQVFP